MENINFFPSLSFISTSFIGTIRAGIKILFSSPHMADMDTRKYTVVLILILVARTNGIKILKIRDVIQRNNSAVEVLGTDVDELDTFTICGRFWNPYLATTLDIWQNIVYIKANDMWLLAKVAIIDCDHRYDGCNDYYRKVLGKSMLFNILKLTMPARDNWSIGINIHLDNLL